MRILVGDHPRVCLCTLNANDEDEDEVEDGYRETERQLR